VRRAISLVALGIALKLSVLSDSMFAMSDTWDVRYFSPGCRIVTAARQSREAGFFFKRGPRGQRFSVVHLARSAVDLDQGMAGPRSAVLSLGDADPR
jgi:hypothetical protein